MPTTIDSLQIEISASAKKADAQIDLLIARLDRLENSLIGAGKNGYKDYSNNADTATRKTKTLSDVLNQFDSSTRRATKSTKSLAYAFGKFYANYFLAIRAIKGAFSSIGKTADYIEAFNYFDVALGKIGSDWSHQFEQYGYDSAEAYSDSFSQRLQKSLSGLSGVKLEIGADGMGILSDSGMANLVMNIQEITKYASQLASVTNSVGQTGEVSLAASSAFTKLAGDISSLFNLDYSSVAKNLQSGLIGQSRALYKYGIDITNATLQTYAYEAGLTKAVSEMTQAEKMQLRMIAILDQSKVSWGDLANTIMSPSNQIRIFKNNLSELSMVFGQLFVPILSKALPILNALTVAFRRLISDIAGFFGIKIDFNSFGKGYSELEEEIDGIGGAFDDATASANKFKTTTLGIDELNINAPQDASGSGSSGISGGFDLTDEILNATQEYEKAWQKAFDNMESRINEFADKITKALEPIRNMFKNLSIGEFELAGADLATFFNNLINPEDFGELGQNIGQFLNNSLDFGIGFVKNFEWDELGDSIATGINEFFKTFDGTKLAEGLNAFADGVQKSILTSLNNLEWSEIWKDVKSFLKELELDTVVITIGLLTIKKVTSVSFVSGALSSIGKSIANSIIGAIALKIGSTPLKSIWDALIASIKGSAAAKSALAFQFSALGELAFSAFTGGFLIAVPLIAGEINDTIDEMFKQIKKQMSPLYNGNYGILGESVFNLPVGIVGADGASFSDYVNNAILLTKRKIKQTVEGFKVRFEVSDFGQTIIHNIAGFKDGINAFGKSINQFGTDTANMFKELGVSISEWWTNDVSIWFTSEKWQELGQGILDGTSAKWYEFTEWWNGTALVGWWEENVIPWFTKEKWTEISLGIKDGISETWNNTVGAWKTDINKWWTENVAPWFTKKKWVEATVGIIDGLKDTFKNAANAVIGIMNNLIDKINDTMSFDWEWTNPFTGKEYSGSATLIELPHIPQFATGGFPEDGLFMANHGELVGKFSNGRTAVANNEQIVSGIEYGVERAVEKALAPYLSYLPTIAQNTRETADKDMSVNIGDREIARANNRGQKALGRRLIMEV